jgi:hypothetical protein
MYNLFCFTVSVSPSLEKNPILSSASSLCNLVPPRNCFPIFFPFRLFLSSAWYVSKKDSTFLSTHAFGSWTQNSNVFVSSIFFQQIQIFSLNLVSRYTNKTCQDRLTKKILQLNGFFVLLLYEWNKRINTNGMYFQ